MYCNSYHPRRWCDSEQGATGLRSAHVTPQEPSKKSLRIPLKEIIAHRGRKNGDFRSVDGYFRAEFSI